MGDVCVGQQESWVPISLKEVNVVMVAAVKSNATVITGRFGGVPFELMLDSRSSISLVQHNLLAQAQDIVESRQRNNSNL